MYAIHFYENKNYVLNQVLRNIPSIDDNVTLKGRKGKVLSVEEIKENVYYVFVEFEKVVDKKKLAAEELAKKKRR
ncbi:hypothetical protein M3193_13885 [Sporosarcina luteola]|uniref:hypothetical protein n=1 Tax=Sporosarcina luteola TaxID=582850 RepID=UPI00203D66C5|nr:hypothetical protein [Sporosarcina luteola]MCM3745225.1 hypothetical protein [Sporosarcina luteola]